MARLSRFSPRSEPHEALEQQTVGREDLCASLVLGIADAVRSGQARFDLVLGPRGAGKSHLLGLIEGRLRKELAGQAVVAGLPEEFHPSSLVHLLAEILRSLPPDPGAGSVERQLALLAASRDSARERAVGMISARLEERPLVIIIENLDIILAAIGRDGQHQLRSILQTQRRWSIVASSRSRAPSFSKESEPFFGTFISRTLEPLTAEECREMLVRLARAYEREELARALDSPKGLARVQTLRHVLGGSPRAMAFVFPHLHHDRPEAVEEALRELAEELTPYFQEQMSRLPPGQRPIAELLAEHWTPMSVTEIANMTFNSQPTVSTYLRRLRDDAIVRSTELGRERFYEISDPLFRIARAMKRDDLRAKTFLKVLQGWYEFRGVDVWQLPRDQMMGIRGLIPQNNQYLDALFEPVLQMLRAGHPRKALEAASAIGVDHPRRIACQILACSNMGDDEGAFELLSSRPSSSVAIVSFVTATHSALLIASRRYRFPRTKRPLIAVRFCSALIAIQRRLRTNEPPPTDETADIERPLRFGSSVVRITATAVLSDLLILAELARRHEFETCERLVRLLGPSNSEALSLNLAVLVLRAWASDQLTIIFRDPKATILTLCKSLGALARAGMLLLLGRLDTGYHYDDLAAAFSEAIEQNGIQANDLSLANRWWMKVLSVLMLPVISGAAGSPALREALANLSSEFHRSIVTMVHEAILCTIAAGQDLTPVISALPLDQSLAHMFGVDATMTRSLDPDAAFVRLAAPERAVVRQFVAFFGLEERLATLAALASDDER